MFDQSLQTARLTLRPFISGDQERVAELMNNWAVVRMLGMPLYPYTLADADEFIAKQLARNTSAEHYASAIVTEAGLIGAICVGPRNDAPSIGYWLGEPYWGQGYMTEALGVSVRAFFAASAWDHLASGYFEDNAASSALQRKFGFEITTEGLEPCVARGEKVRHFETRLTRATFEAQVA